MLIFRLLFVIFRLLFSSRFPFIACRFVWEDRRAFRSLLADLFGRELHFAINFRIKLPFADPRGSRARARARILSQRLHEPWPARRTQLGGGKGAASGQVRGNRWRLKGTASGLANPFSEEIYFTPADERAFMMDKYKNSTLPRGLLKRLPLVECTDPQWKPTGTRYRRHDKEAFQIHRALTLVLESDCQSNKRWQLWGGGKQSYRCWDTLKANDIKTVLSATHYPAGGRPCRGVEYPPQCDINAMCEGILPFAELAERLVELDHHLTHAGSALVNCLKGANRTGALLAAFIMAKCQVGVDEAMEYLVKLRPIIDIYDPAAENTVSPYEYLQVHEEMLKTLFEDEDDIAVMQLPVVVNEYNFAKLITKEFGMIDKDVRDKIGIVTPGELGLCPEGDAPVTPGAAVPEVVPKLKLKLTPRIDTAPKLKLTPRIEAAIHAAAGSDDGQGSGTGSVKSCDRKRSSKSAGPDDEEEGDAGASGSAQDATKRAKTETVLKEELADLRAKAEAKDKEVARLQAMIEQMNKDLASKAAKKDATDATTPRPKSTSESESSEKADWDGDEEKSVSDQTKRSRSREKGRAQFQNLRNLQAKGIKLINLLHTKETPENLTWIDDCMFLPEEKLEEIANVRDGNGVTPLHAACRMHKMGIVTKLLNSHPGIADAKTYAAPSKPASWTPLMCLCDTPIARMDHHHDQRVKNFIEMALLLMDSMSKEALSEQTESSDATFLHMLCARGHREPVREVLNHLRSHLQWSDAEIAKLINTPGSKGKGCVDTAFKNDVMVAKELIKYGGKPLLDNPSAASGQASSSSSWWEGAQWSKPNHHERRNASYWERGSDSNKKSDWKYHDSRENRWDPDPRDW